VLDTACGYAAYTVLPPEAAALTATFTVMQATMSVLYNRPGISGS